MSSDASTFKAIIVGGGPVGLITAHCFAKAGIDYEILEKRPDSGLNTGTSSALWPQTVRVFDQLDILDAVYKIQYPTKHKVNLCGDGMILNENDFYAEAGAAFGHPAMFLHRQEMVDMLEQHLPGASPNSPFDLPGFPTKQRLHFDKQVTTIELTTDPAPGQEVTVTCSDGTCYTGSIVIGADGVYSTVRRLMNSKLGFPATGPKSNTEPMKTTYLGLFGSCSPLTIPKSAKSSGSSTPSSPGPNMKPNPEAQSVETEEGDPMPVDTFFETHGPNFALQLGLHHKRTFFAIYHRIPTQPSGGSLMPRRDPYTEEEKASLAEQYANLHVSPWHTFSDAWNARIWDHMANLEEGVASTWSSSDHRIVLLGDSIHKHTPIAGLGFNAGVQSAVVLTNLLHSALKTPPSQKPTATGSIDLKQLFTQYQNQRKPPATREADLSKLYTRVVSWDNPLWKLADRYILPKVNGDILLLKLIVSKIMKDGEVLDFAEEKNFREGTIKWRVPRTQSKVHI
ncbi:hypothetical protein V8F06_001542 [Rhypophila decipiens]